MITIDPTAIEKKIIQNRVTTAQPLEMLSPAEAFAGLILAAIAADGYLADEELEGLTHTLSRMHLFKGYSSDRMERMLHKLFGILRRQGFVQLFNSAKHSLPVELQEPAFAVAADLIFSDGIVAEQELNFLDRLHRELDISAETAEKIIDVMMIKNRG